MALTRTWIGLGTALGGLLTVALVGVLWLEKGGGDPEPVAQPVVEPEVAEIVAVETEPIPPTPQEPEERVRKEAPLHWIERALGVGNGAEIAAEPTGKVEGRLAWESSGLPIEGARVTLTRMALDSLLPMEAIPAEDDEPTIDARTDARGFFLLEGVPRRSSWFLRFEKKHLVEVRPLRTLPDEPDVRTWQGEYRVPEQGTLRGTVVDERGKPLRGVRVRAVDDPMFEHPELPEDVALARRRALHWFVPGGNLMGEPMAGAVSRRDRLLPFPETLTDKAGQFVLRGVRRGRVQLVLQGERHAGSRSQVEVAAFEDRHLGRIVLLPAEPLRIEVVDSAEKPVAGVRISVRPLALRFGPPPQWTDDKGRAVFYIAGSDSDAESRRPDVDVRDAEVMVQRGPGGPWESLGYAKFPATTLTLWPAEGWKCRVRSVDGRTLDRLRWRVVPATPGFRVTEGLGGLQVFRGLPRRADLLLVGSADGFAPVVVRHLQRREFLRLLDAGKAPELTAYPTTSARIRVVDELGEPVPRARVFAQVSADDRFRGRFGTEWGNLGPLPLGRTDAQGRLEAEGLWDASTGLSVEHRDFGQHFALRIEPANGGEHVLRVDRWAAVQGAVVGDFVRTDRRMRIVASHRPFDPQAEQPRASVSTVSTAEGFFELPKLTPGRWVLRALDPVAISVRIDQRRTRPRIWAEREVVLGPELDLHQVILELKEPDPPALSGMVRIGGQPRAGLRVRVLGARLRSAQETRTDGDGRFGLVEGLRSWSSSVRGGGWTRGRDVIQVAAQHYGSWSELAVVEVPRDEPSGRDVEIEIDIPVGGVSLVITGPTGAPLANRLIRLRHVDLGFSRLLLSRADGRAIGDGVPPGPWRVELPTAEGSPSLAVDDTIAVVAGERREYLLHAVVRARQARSD